MPGLFVPPVFESISFDSSGTNDYVKKHNRQRKLFDLIGDSFVVGLVEKVLRNFIS